MARIRPDTTLQKQHVPCGPNMRECQPYHPPKEMLASPCSSSRAATGPNNRSALIAIELSGAQPHPDIKSSHRMTDASPPAHGEVTPSTTKQLLSREAVSEEETSVMRHSPIPSAALSLHERMPAFSMQATPSCLERHDLEIVVSSRIETNIDTYRMVAPDVPCLTDPRLVTEGPPREKRPETRRVISNSQASTRESLPAPKVALALPNQSLAFSM
jgi:hypothetical protein